MEIPDLDTLLQGHPGCACGRVHTCAMRRGIVKAGAVREVGRLSEGWSRILLVADNNTYPICGESIAAQLAGRLQDTLVYSCDGLLVPDETAIETLKSHVRGDTDLIIGIGSGVINDLCKYVSYLCGITYFIVATATSMDGYNSVHAAMIIGGMKITYSAHMVHTVIADIDILKNAPMDMIQGGYGDIIGKYSALNDWKLGKVLYGEYFCQDVYDLILAITNRTASLGPALLRRDGAAIGQLMEAILAVGAAMAWVGNSRPASGSEHHLSHYYEVTGLMRHEPYFLHGMDVAFSTLDTARMRQQLLKLDAIGDTRTISPSRREAAIRRIYGASADGILELQKKVGRYDTDVAALCREKWPQVKEVLSEVPTAEALTELFRSVGMRTEDYEELYSEEKRADAWLWAKDLKDRFTVLWIWYALMGK